jgi:hypothetical protein
MLQFPVSDQNAWYLVCVRNICLKRAMTYFSSTCNSLELNIVCICNAQCDAQNAECYVVVPAVMQLPYKLVFYRSLKTFNPLCHISEYDCEWTVLSLTILRLIFI